VPSGACSIKKSFRARVLLQHALAQGLAPLGVLVHDEHIALGAELAFEARHHVFHGTSVRVRLGNGGLREHILQVLQDDQALLEDAPVGRLQDRQRRRAAGFLQEPVRPGLRDVDDAKIHLIPQPLERQQDLQPLAERADGNVVDGEFGGCGHGHRCGAGALWSPEVIRMQGGGAPLSGLGRDGGAGRTAPQGWRLRAVTAA
jgi:hypothetical protein